MALSRTVAALTGAVLISTALVGCGSSSDDTLTKKEFQRQGNKLCADANKDAEGYGADLSEKSSDADAAEFVAKLTARNNKLVDDIDALKAPKELADDVDSMLASVRAGIKDFKKISTMHDLTEFDPDSGNFGKANDKARAVGLDTCAE